MNQLAKNLKYYRLQNKMSQEELASKIFVTRQTISNYENGKSEPDLDMLSKIAEPLNIPPENLLNKPENLKWDKKLLAGLIICILAWILLSIAYGMQNLRAYQIYDPVAAGFQTMIRPYGYVLLIMLTSLMFVELIRKKFRLQIDLFQKKAIRYIIYALSLIVFLIVLFSIGMLLCSIFEYISWEYENPLGGTYYSSLRDVGNIIAYTMFSFEQHPILYAIPLVLGSMIPFTRKK